MVIFSPCHRKELLSSVFTLSQSCYPQRSLSLRKQGHSTLIYRRLLSVSFIYFQGFVIDLRLHFERGIVSLQGKILTDSVTKILDCYDGDNPGTVSQLARILNHGALGGTGKLVILPVDQGFEHGPAASFAPNPPAYDPFYHFQMALYAGCNAYAAPFGFLDSAAREFAGQIPLILKANGSDSLYKDKDSPLPAITAGVEEALRLGCSAIGFTIYPGSGVREQMYEDAIRLGREARQAGLALVIWSYPRGAGLSKEGETAVDVVAYAAQIAAQLGAHIIKVKPPTSFFEKQEKIYTENKIQIQTLSQRVKHVIQSAFDGRRIVVFSGGPGKGKENFLQEIQELAEGGAFGSIVGRNVFQRPKAEALDLLKQIIDIYKKAAS